MSDGRRRPYHSVGCMMSKRPCAGHVSVAGFGLCRIQHPDCENNLRCCTQSSIRSRDSHRTKVDCISVKTDCLTARMMMMTIWRCGWWSCVQWCANEMQWIQSAHNVLTYSTHTHTQTFAHFWITLIDTHTDHGWGRLDCIISSRRHPMFWQGAACCLARVSFQWISTNKPMLWRIFWNYIYIYILYRFDIYDWV